MLIPGRLRSRLIFCVLSLMAQERTGGPVAAAPVPEKDDQHSIESNFNIAEIAPPVLRYGATFSRIRSRKSVAPAARAEGAVVKQRQQQRPGRGFTGGDEQIAVVELLPEAGALGFHTRQHPLGCPVEG